LILRNYVVVATSNIGSRMLMESRSTDRDNFGASNQPDRPYRRHSNQTDGALEVSPDELKQYDTRAPIADLKRLIDLDPKLGFAFRTVVEKVKNGELTAEDIIVKLSKRKSRA
jgi:hypothetical protein